MEKRGTYDSMLLMPELLLMDASLMQHSDDLQMITQNLSPKCQSHGARLSLF